MGARSISRRSPCGCIAGSESQAADPLIVAKEGAANAPAYRGLAYVVFERLPLAEFGNRVPQFSFEVVRPVDGLNRMVRAVCLIPGASEFGYDDLAGDAGSRPRRDASREPPPAAAHDAMSRPRSMRSRRSVPNLKRVSLVVSWFGDDLRAGACAIEPRVDCRRSRPTAATWSVAGLDARGRQGRVAGRRRAGLWRHAVGRIRDPPDPRSEGSAASRWCSIRS